MHNARGMGRRQPRCDLRYDRARFGAVHPPRPDALLQRAPLVVGHRDEELPVPLPDLVDRRDVGVVERARSLRLAQETRPGRRVQRLLGRQELQRHGPPQTRVPRPVHDPHPAAADPLLEPELREQDIRHRHDVHGPAAGVAGAGGGRVDGVTRRAFARERDVPRQGRCVDRSGRIGGDLGGRRRGPDQPVLQRHGSRGRDALK